MLARLGGDLEEKSIGGLDRLAAAIKFAAGFIEAPIFWRTISLAESRVESSRQKQVKQSALAVPREQRREQPRRQAEAKVEDHVEARRRERALKLRQLLRHLKAAVSRLRINLIDDEPKRSADERRNDVLHDERPRPSTVPRQLPDEQRSEDPLDHVLASQFPSAHS